MKSFVRIVLGAASLAAAASLPAGTVLRRDVPVGQIITQCTTPGVVALTFDDGPHANTARVLELLDQYGAHATFFVNGDNYGRGLIDDPSTPWPDTIRRMRSSGHQVGSHTWAHVDLSTVDSATRASEMERLDAALVNIMGQSPTYMRPPYGSCSGECLSFLGGAGYHAINWNLDTNDWANQENIQVSKDIYSSSLQAGSPSSSSFIVLSHDVHAATVNELVEHELITAQNLGYRFTTVGECLGDPESNWYR